jgi:hypothetical protein
MRLKTLLLTLLLILSGMFYQLAACPACKSNQPKVLENITHGEGPAGYIDYFITWSAIVIVSITLYLSIKYLVNPKEHNSDHIKNIVVHEDPRY